MNTDEKPVTYPGLSSRIEQRRMWTPYSVTRRAWDVLREDGPATLFFKVLGESVYRRVWLFERPLDEPIADVVVAADIEFGVLHPNEFERCSELRPECSADELHRKLARDECCFVARKSGLVIGQVWVVRHSAWIEYLRCTLNFGPDDYYLYELEVTPELRGQHIAGALFTHAYRELGKKGGSRAIFAVTLENRAALRALTRNGERRFALQGYIGRGRLRHVFRRDLV